MRDAPQDEDTLVRVSPHPEEGRRPVSKEGVKLTRYPEAGHHEGRGEAMHKMSAAEFQALVERELPLAHWLGFRAERLGDGKATIRLPFKAETMRPGGTIAGPAMMA